MSEGIQSGGRPANVVKPAYESSKIEEIVTAEEMEREVHYAGVGSGNMN